MPDDDSQQCVTIPVLEETVRIGKRSFEKQRVVVRKSVHERDETVEALLRMQHISVERIPVNQPVSQAPPIRKEGEWLIVPVLQEELVVEKRLVLKEELRIRRHETEQPERRTVRLRTETVSVDEDGDTGREN